MDQAASIVKEHHDAIINAIKSVVQRDWRILIVDDVSKKIIESSVKEDDILNVNIANIQEIEEPRDENSGMDAIYILSPRPHIVECLILDLAKGRYRNSTVLWTGILGRELRARLASAPQKIDSRPLLVDFFPRESHLVSFKDPYSFPILYNPSCEAVAMPHLDALAQKIAAVCITLGEYPKIRFFAPRNSEYRASALCGRLAALVQDELDAYKQFKGDFPPQTTRPQGYLLIADRSMDLMAPLVHEFTYQAMAHDLLPIKEGDKVTFHMTVNEGTPEAEEKDMELSDKDKVWVENRHRHMKDTIEKLMSDFQNFIKQNPNFTNQNQDTTSLNAIRDMLAGLPQFQEMKEAYSLHLTMAQESMNIFQRRKLPDVASVEQTLATGLDEDYKKPKDILEQMVRLLDDEAITWVERLRLIAIYVLYRDGVIIDDIDRLLNHAALQPAEKVKITNLQHLGARPTRKLKEERKPHPPLFPRTQVKNPADEDNFLSRFEPAVKHMLEDLFSNCLDPAIFPFTRPPTDGGAADAAMTTGGSLRSAAPRWASANRRQVENRQRVIVFMAGGATYSEARICYEESEKRNRDIYLVTSHMLTPQLYLRQLEDLSMDRRRLGLPMDRPQPQVPEHFYAKPKPPPQPVQQPPAAAPPGAGSVHPPTQAMGAMTMNSGTASPHAGGSGARPPVPPAGKTEKPVKEKKKRNLFGLKKS
ncbi:Sec1-like protein [Neurospora hispaniola]|uniref:Sec1-like protein n=1 Tax=Neurospora hispaniola TaxID=588809 RepID=A0AAJ0I260_9PEZI|nr:Sec1-like protein [Neurospora hispaniola]